ncbi:NAD(P)/FAD-dependent oxidoreductase [Methanoculleus sp.]|uniref:NAD(P)/FAD-dependent oxidoreductase n=1 Tax=Methanoculleus sp. TaxID=90427 RepID=UPI0032100FE5
MLDRCDVIVVGAGPAGSTAARYAAEKGLDVLLIDKKKEIGVPVCCGEFNAAPAVLAEALPNAPGIAELFSIDPGLIQRVIRGFVVTSPKGREYEFDLSGYTVNRDAFDRYLADAAVCAGAVLSPDTTRRIQNSSAGKAAGSPPAGAISMPGSWSPQTARSRGSAAPPGWSRALCLPRPSPAG